MPTTLDPSKVKCTCSQCGEFREVKPTPKGIPRTPKGWKNKSIGFLCGKCQKSAFRLRAVEFRIASVVEGGTWKEFLDACKVGWANSTSILNWAVATLWTNDERRLPEMSKCPKMPTIYLYGLCNDAKLFQDVSSTSRQSLFQLADSRYRKRRYEVIWQGAASLPNARYPQPYPVPSANWTATAGTDNTMLLSFPMGGIRWTVRLLGGPLMKAKIADFNKLLCGAAEGGQLDIIRSLEGSSGHRETGKTGEDNDPETGKKVSIGIKLKISGWFPREPIKDLFGIMSVRTDSESFVIATLNDGRRDPWILHAQQIRRAIARHRRWLICQSDDRKFEKRRPRRKAVRYNAGTQARAFRHCEIVKNWIHESTRWLTSLAARQRIGIVKFDKQETFVESFPWHQWETTLASKLDAIGIVYVKSKSSGEVLPE